MAKEEKMATLEVTEEQKAEIVAFMAKKKEKADDAVVSKQLVTINLNFEHQRNETKYFGKVSVASDLAASLIVADQKMLEARLRENQSNDHLIKIIGRGMAQTTTTKVIG